MIDDFVILNSKFYILHQRYGAILDNPTKAGTI